MGGWFSLQVEILKKNELTINYVRIKINMLIPVRCFTCNKVIASKWDKYNDLLRKGQTIEIALNEIGFRRYCCRRMFLSHVNTIDKLLELNE